MTLCGCASKNYESNYSVLMLSIIRIAVFDRVGQNSEPLLLSQQIVILYNLPRKLAIFLSRCLQTGVQSNTNCFSNKKVNFQGKSCFTHFINTAIDNVEKVVR